jgi:hypothetical protein
LFIALLKIQNLLHMKTLITLFSVLLASVSISAQITINRSDFGTIGDLLYYANDTTLSSSFTPGASGPNATWNFSTTVSANFYDSSLFADPATVGGAPEEANIAIIQGDAPSFFNITDSSVKIIIPLDMFGNGTANPQIMITKFPFTYGAPALKDSAFTHMQGTPEDFGYSGLPFDSMRINFAIRTTSLVDAWGAVTTPIATYDALRVKNTTNVKVTVQGKAPFLGWIDVPFDGLNQNQIIYGWYAKDKKYTVAEAALDTLGNVANFRYQVASIPTSTGIEKISKNVSAMLQPNPVNDVLTLSFNSNYNEKGSLLIFDITGKVVVNQEITLTKNENAITVKTADLNNGVYFTRIVSEHINSTSKFVVRH